jgi:hypothetical protein
MVTAPKRGPRTVGVDVIESVQVIWGSTLEPQSFVTAKSPLAVTLEITRVPSPLFVIDTVLGELVEPTPWSGKMTLDWDKAQTGRIRFEIFATKPL